MQTGEFFLKDKEKKHRELENKMKKQEKKMKEK